MKLRYDSYKSIFILHKNLTKELFLGKIGVKKGTYAEDMFSRIYDCIHSELIELPTEYQNYYRDEYQDFYHFLYHKLNLSRKVISKIKKVLESNEDYRIYRKEDNTYGDYSVEHFAFTETINERITNILLLRDLTNESKI